MSNARFSILQSKAVEDDTISDPQFRTLAALGCFGDKDGWCFPSLKTLAAKLHKSPQAVSKDIGRLTELGYLEKHPRFDKDGSRKSNLYRIKFDTPSTPEVDRVSIPEVEAPSIPEVEVNAPSNEPVNGKKKADKPPTPPEVILYHSVTKRYPKTEVYGDVCSAIQNISARLRRPCEASDLEPFFKAWLLRSRNEYNFSVWLLEWAVNGSVTTFGKPKQKENNALENYIARLEAAQ